MTALKIFCMVLSGISFIAFLVATEKGNKPAYLVSAIFFTVLAVVMEVRL